MKILPWEQVEYEDCITSNSYIHDSVTETNRQFQHISDNESLKYRKGDIVKILSGLYQDCSWKGWFLTPTDYQDFLKTFKNRDKKIPLYAANQYSMVVGRYRIVKRKYCGIFYDYGTLLMTLTGTKIGRIKKYFSRYPFYLVSNYPHNQIPFDTDIKDILLMNPGNSNDSRNKYVYTIFKKITEE